MTSRGVYPVDVYIDSRNSDFPVPWSTTTARQVGTRDYVNKTFNDFTGQLVGFKLVEVNLPFSYYVIDEQFTTLILDRSGVAITATIAQGNYTPDELALELTTKINAASAGTLTSVTYSLVTNKFTYTPAGAVSIIFKFGALNDASTATVSNVWASVLGFNADSTSATGTAGSPLVSTRGINLAGDDCVYLCSSRLAPHLYTSVFKSIPFNVPNLNNAICQIPVSVNRNETIQYANPQWFYFQIGLTRLDSLDFYFCNGEGRILSLNGLYFSLKMSFLAADRSTLSLSNENQSSTQIVQPFWN